MEKPNLLKTPHIGINYFLNKNKDVVLINNDCLKVIKKLPDGSVDLIISSPPYCMGKEYESSSDIHDFVNIHRQLLPELVRVLKPNGSLCWQVGTHVLKGIVTPLDALIVLEMMPLEEMQLRNRIIWTVGHGLHCTNRFSGRHESILWYTKGSNYIFNLDEVRIPQKYPGKKYSKGPNKGIPSGNPLGKNPGDVWEIPNVKASHIEKTEHPCQFPVAIPQLLIRALTDKNMTVMDPFMGSGSTGVAAALEKRKFIGCDTNQFYCAIAQKRISNTLKGTEPIRPWNKEVEQPNPNEKVAQKPSYFVS